MHESSNAACMLFNFLTGSHIADDDIKMAEDKFAESLHLAQLGMFNLLENDVSYFDLHNQFFLNNVIIFRQNKFHS